jgi:hypothetical protein
VRRRLNENGTARSSDIRQRCLLPKRWQEYLQELAFGTEYRFSEWPNSAVPSVAAGVYTIWNHRTLIYVGMAGRGHTEESLARGAAQPKYVTGLRSRLKSYTSGRRSGDQFCVYVADRFILPVLKMQEVQAIGPGEVSLGCTSPKVHPRIAYLQICGNAQCPGCQ